MNLGGGASLWAVEKLSVMRGIKVFLTYAPEGWFAQGHRICLETSISNANLITGNFQSNIKPDYLCSPSIYIIGLCEGLTREASG